MTFKKQKAFTIYKHQNKADALENALKQFGWAKSGNLHIVSAGFFDIDILQRVEMFDTLHNWGLKLFVYPHQARPNIIYAWKESKPHPHTTAHFVSGPGHEEIMRIIGYDKPIHDIGWSMCPKKPFQPVEKVQNVLLGLLHPNAPHLEQSPWLHEVDKETNRKAFDRLLKASREMGFHLTVRYLHDIVDNGLEGEVEGVTWVRGRMRPDTEDIDRADLVVGTQTFAYKAIARGKPTLMMDEHICPKAGNSDTSFAYIRDWDKIADKMMYPLDLNTTTDVNALITRASQTDEDIRDWRSRMIGRTFSGREFVDIVNQYCGY